MGTKRFSSTLALFLALASFGLGGTLLFAAKHDNVITSSDTRQDVAEAQGILRSLDLLAAGSYREGEMDDATVAAVKWFQIDHILRPTGAIDRETMAQLLQHQPGKDSDGDGVMDGRDKCPNTPRGAIVDKVGCPLDSDGDGVWDGLDQCPDTPRGWPVDMKGCPLDTDGDGVADGKDKCPNTPKACTVNADGCPADADGDGVCDGIDKCPNTPKGCRVDARGCPIDSDGDGACDGIDQCPGTPSGVQVDAKGCPPPAPAYIPEAKQEIVLERVFFETNSATLKPESSETLDKVAASLKDYPDVKIQVAGHTDSTGSAAYNLKLSDKRASAVMNYLISKGVNPAMLSEKGYGLTEPIADNKTAAGRAQNRRVGLRRVN
jgi:outer membrane protein OmpA-like peptidoglycan-associated protein